LPRLLAPFRCRCSNPAQDQLATHVRSSTSPTKALSVRENSPALLERRLWSQIAKLLGPSHQAGDCGPFGDDRI
jgi:hypothetical protein